MSKIYFRYGAMNSSKTANALMVVYNYQERGQQALLVKPSIDTREGRKAEIQSRIGLAMPAVCSDEFETMSYEKIVDYDCIVIDEAQFLTENEIQKIIYIADKLEIPVICYGLRTDFTGRLFPGSKRLMEMADTIEEIKTICWCGKKATFNARINENGEMLSEGPQVLMGGNDRYVAVCRKHYYERRPQK